MLDSYGLPFVFAMYTQRPSKALKTVVIIHGNYFDPGSYLRLRIVN